MISITNWLISHTVPLGLALLVAWCAVEISPPERLPPEESKE